MANDIKSVLTKVKHSTPVKDSKSDKKSDSKDKKPNGFQSIVNKVTSSYKPTEQSTSHVMWKKK